MKRELAMSGLVVVLALHSSGAHAAPPFADAASASRILMADAGFLPIIGAVWFFVALVFVLSLARVTVRKVCPTPGFVHDPWVPARGLGLLLLLALHPSVALAAPPLAIAAATNRVLIIDRSSTAVSGGKATLSISPLQRTLEIYAGDYQMKVSPYFFKGEKGKLAIVVSGESLARVTKGIAADITGTATTSGKDGQTRRIDATATPLDNNRGALKLWFISGNRKVVFNTSYHFFEK